jgi:two-component system NtrC family response regulator
VHLPPEIAAAGGAAPACALEGGLEGDLTLAMAERAHILRVLVLTEYNKARAARALGITRATLYVKLREYQLGTTLATRDGT